MRIGYVMQEGGPDIRERPLRGPANHVWNALRELRSLGHQVRLLASYDKVIWKADDLEDFERVTGLDLDRGPRRRIESAVRGAQSRLHLPYLNFYDSLRFSHACQIELAKCELIYERMGWMGYGGGLAANRMKIPLVLEANNGDFITELKMKGVLPRGLQLWLSVRLMQAAVGRATHVVATGEGHRRRFIDQWKVRPEKVSVIENGTELVGLLRREQLRAFGAPPGTEDAVRLVFAGSFEPWQGVLVLLRAVRRVLSKGCRVHLTLIGTGSQLPEVTRLIRELSLEAHVTLTGPVAVDGLALRLAESEIGVAPYCGWMEFSGLKLFDYKAAGLAIIASGRDGQPRALQHGRTAWIVPPCDEEALSDAILRLASDVGRRRSMGQEARLEAECSHTWQHTADQLQQVFETVLAKGNPASPALQRAAAPLPRRDPAVRMWPMRSPRLYFRANVRKFVLFLVARVGSTYLTTLLQSHPDILALSEELKDRESLGAQAQLDWTEKFLTPPIIGTHAVRGFNVKVVHLADPAAFAQLLRKQECLIVHMHRRNRVKAVISRINGQRLYKKTGMYGLFEEANRMPPLEIDLEEFDQFLKHREKVDSELEDYVNSLGLPLHQLCYEDLLARRDESLDRLFHFLGARPMPVKGETLKITSDDLRAAIVNFDQLRAKYVGTQYEPMFDEVLLPATAPA